MMIGTRAILVLALLLAPTLVRGEVSRVEVTSRTPAFGGRSFGDAGDYEYIAGRVFFSVDPSDERNRVVVDLDKAPMNAAGRVEFSADLAILRPRNASRGNGISIVDIVNRGGKRAVSTFNRAAPSASFMTNPEAGDGLLMREGYTIVWVGWEFDVLARPGIMRIEIPSAGGVAGIVRGRFTPDGEGFDYTVSDLGGYRPSDPGSPQNTLTVRDHLQDVPVTIQRSDWTLTGNSVHLQTGFRAGGIYELSYEASEPPVAGLGFVAVRDTAAWIKYMPGALATTKYAVAFGVSQSGRFLREFLYYGFNTDEGNRPVFDAVWAHIAGAARLNLNTRWATPTSLAMYTATSFPFADAKLPDPITGNVDGATDNSRSASPSPRIFYTNTSVEYWGGGRAAALIHTTPDGLSDIALPSNVRIYFLTGSQHGPASFPPSVRNGQQKDNPTDYYISMRALLMSLSKWVLKGVEPLPSRYPRLHDGTLVRAADVAFPRIFGVASPRTLTAGVRSANPLLHHNGAAGTAIPLLVPQVDRDGNEFAGLRLPDIAIPLGTYTGWNFRNTTIGGTDQLFPLIGSYIPFAATKAVREGTYDPRPSIEERYGTRERYLKEVERAGASLVKEGYLLRVDLPEILRRAGEHWDLYNLSGRK